MGREFGEAVMCSCYRGQLCAYHRAEQEILERIENERSLDVEWKAFSDAPTVEEHDTMRLIMRNYDAEKYWRLQRMHRAGER